MKNHLFAVLGLALLTMPVLARGSSRSYKSSTGRHYTRTYTTKRGTVVKGHYSTNPNHRFGDNWSTKGNRNPVTGTAGTKVTPPAGEVR